ncbi:MAG: hypothetical protein NT131_06345 [Methanomassiliicoccales archaeon]|nr:hypothetical protein [Methanomassiliicoccales archaeon]
MSKAAVLLMVLAVLMAAAVPGSASAMSTDGEAVIAANGHLVLLNFTVSEVSLNDSSEAGNVRYLVYLDQDSLQDSFDVFIMDLGSYQEYISGGVFQLVIGWCSNNAGVIPAYNYVLLFSAGQYVLVIDNTDVGSAPSSPAELTVHYEVTADNVEMQQESRWDLFIALMVLIGLIGVAFLLLVNFYTKIKLEKVLTERKKKCLHCGETSESDGKYCPHCGKER